MNWSDTNGRQIKNNINAISLLIDETFEQYDDETEWFKMLQNELGCTKEELEQYGIYITVAGGLEKNFIEMK